MATHCSHELFGLTERQAFALDRMARENDIWDGMDLLIKISGRSRSSIGRLDPDDVRQLIDEAFRRWGPAAQNS